MAKIETEFTRMMGIDYPIIGAPMFLVSYEELVISVAEAGGLGAIPLPNFFKIEDLKKTLTNIRKATDKPIGVNIHLSGMFEWKAQLALCLDAGVKFFITSLGDPRLILDDVHANGGKVFADIISLEQGLKARDRGVDGLIAVASGDGLKDIFGSLGAASVVPGGQTMNPSTKDILQTVESTFSDKIIILPNNKNIISTANQVQSLTQKKVDVIPTRTIPQGVAALLAFDYEADFKTNSELMEKAIASVKSIEVTRSVRATKINGLKIKKKQPIGLLDGELIAAGTSNADVINRLLPRLNIEKAEVVTIYHGEEAETGEAEQISADITERYPHLQIELIKGGQPHYSYIISIE